MQQHSTPVISVSKTYLISGGLGGVGLKVAAWLVNQGARNVVLMGRSAANEEAQKTISQMKAEGAKIVVIQADVAQPAHVTQAIAKIKHSMPVLGGIIHAAGVLDDKILAHQSWESFKGVLEPKIKGAWNLHNATAGLPLDFFCLFSSQAALWGLSRSSQGAYAAANCFLDAFANFRRSRGLTGVSINWGAWADVGMAANLSPAQQRGRIASGYGQIKPNQGLELFKRILQLDESNIAVLPIDWVTFLHQYSVVPPFFSELFAEKYRSKTEPSISDVNEISTNLRIALKGDHQALTNYLCGAIAKLSGASEATLPLDRSLLELGVDSLMALELRNRIVHDLKVDVPIVRFLEGSKIEQLINLLIKQLQTEPAESKNQLPRSTVSNRPFSESSNEQTDWEEGEV